MLLMKLLRVTAPSQNNAVFGKNSQLVSPDTVCELARLAAKLVRLEVIDRELVAEAGFEHAAGRAELSASAKRELIAGEREVVVGGVTASSDRSGLSGRAPGP